MGGSGGLGLFLLLAVLTWPKALTCIWHGHVEDLFATVSEGESCQFVCDEISFKGTVCTSVSEEVLETSTSVSVSVPLEPLSDCKPWIQKWT